MRTLYNILISVLVILLGVWAWYIHNELYHKHMPTAAHRDSLVAAWYACVKDKQAVWIRIDDTVHKVVCRIRDQMPYSPENDELKKKQ